VPIKPYAADFDSDEEFDPFENPDYLIYNGKKYILEDDIFQPCFKKTNEWKWTGKMDVLDCAAPEKYERDYYSIFEIVGNELILKDIRDSTKKSILKEFLSAFAVKNSILKLDWFADSIFIGIDEPLYHGIHEYYSILHFEKGILVKETRTSYKEYLSYILKRTLEDLSNENYYDKAIFGIQSENGYKHNLETIDFYLETKKGDKSEFLTELKTKYRKKFGKPISDFELKIQKIYYWYSEFSLIITRTRYGAQATYEEKPGEQIVARFDIEEWLDIIRDLYTCCLDKWERVPQPTNKYMSTVGGWFYIYSSSKHPYSEDYAFPIRYHIKAKPPHLKEFEKVLEDIIEKIKKHPSSYIDKYEIIFDISKSFGDILI